MIEPLAKSERIVRQMERGEMERRWTLLRGQISALGVQAVVTLGSDDFLGGYLRWLTDRPATNAYHAVAIFHEDAPMTLVEHGNIGGRRNVAAHPEYAGVEDVFTTTSWRSVDYTFLNEALIVRDVLRKRGTRRLGLAGAGGMPHAFVAALLDMDLEIVDVTALMDRCKAIKSAAEMTEIRATAAMQDEIFQVLLERVKPGMRDLDVMALAQYEGRIRGSEQGVFLVSSQPLGKPTLLAPPHFQGRTIQGGDHVTVLIENAGSAGYYAELGRTIVLGKASAALLDSMDLAVDAQKNTLARMTPGMACAEIAAAHDAFLDAHGLERETRLYAHGQGYDLVERPLVRAEETGVIAAGMNMVVHPAFVANGAFGYVCDNFMIPEQGPPQPLHATEQRVFEI